MDGSHLLSMLSKTVCSKASEEKLVKLNGLNRTWIILAACWFFMTGLLFGCGSAAQEETDSTVEYEESGESGMEEGGEASNTGSSSSALAAVESTGNAADYDGLEITIVVPKDAVTFTEEAAASFQEAYEVFAGVTILVESEEDAEADLLIFTQEQLEQMVLSGELDPVPSYYMQGLIREQDAGAIEAASVDDTIYAWPLAIDSGYFLYYDASVITDPSSLETILAECEATGRTFYMEINSGWYQTAFFFGTGCTLIYEVDADGSFVSADMDYASEAGVTALREILETAASDAFRNGSAAGDTENMAAIVGGQWDELLVQELLGETYACAPLPSFIGADGETYQLSGFAGYELLGVIPQEDAHMSQVCHAFASWLTGGEMQSLRFQSEGDTPTNLSVQESDLVQADAAQAALIEQAGRCVIQRQYPGDYWTMAASLGDDIVLRSLTSEASDEDLLEALQTFQDQCLSYTE